MNRAPENASVEIVEVGPRDGFQGIGPFIPTETKIEMLERLVAEDCALAPAIRQVRQAECCHQTSAPAAPFGLPSCSWPASRRSLH